MPSGLIQLLGLPIAAVFLGGVGLAAGVLRLRFGRREDGDASDSPTLRQEAAPAGRGRRLGAVLLDGVLTTPLALIAQGWGYADTNTVDPVGAVALAGFLILQNIQIYLLAVSGQTIGKRTLRIRIVDARTGDHPSWFRLVVLRVFVNRILVAATLLLYGLMDALFIFRDDRRTIHDRLARTRVDRVGE